MLAEQLILLAEQVIRQEQMHHHELQPETEQSRIAYDLHQSSVVNTALARTGDLFVVIGQGLQQRYRRVEEGVSLAEDARDRRLERAL